MKDKTGKLIIKVIFISFAVIIVFFSSIVLFNTAKGDHILNVTKKALEDKDYNEVLSLFGGIYYEEPVITDSDDNIDLIVNPTYVERSFNYLVLNDNDQSENHFYHKFLKSYSFFIFDANFTTTTKISNGKRVNNAGVKFITDKIDDEGNNVTHTYPFIISATVNTTKTFDSPESVVDYELNYKRDIIADQEKYGFYNFTINSNVISAVEDITEGQIIGFNITDSIGKDVFSSDFSYSFNFDEPFFQEEYNGLKQGGVIEKIYNTYIPYYDSYKINNKKYVADNYVSEYDDADTYGKMNEKFNNDVKKFLEDVKAGNIYDSNVKVSKTESEIITNTVIAKCVWRTIGIEALVLVVIAVIYILLFHFQQLRDFIFRNDRRVPIRPKVQNVEPNKEQKAKFNYDQSGRNVIDTKPEEVEVEEAEAISEETKENNEE